MNKGFNYFPEKLYSKVVKINNLKTLGFFSMSNPQEIYYSIKDGNWSDVSIWETVSGRTAKAPSLASDDVYIRHSVTTNTNATINNLFISGSILFDNTARTITVNGDIRSSGAVDMSNAGHTLVLLGINNYIVSFTEGISSTINYARFGDQPIMNLTYQNLSATGSGTKYPVADLTTLGNVLIGSKVVLDFITYNGTVNGSVNNQDGTLAKSGAGNLLFVGLVTASFTANTSWNFSGNPDIEFRGGYKMYGFSFTGIFNTGTGNWTFTTNDQSILSSNNSTGIVSYNCNLIVAGAITVTLDGGHPIRLNQSLTGTLSTSTFKIGSLSVSSLYFNNAAYPVMATGILDKSSVLGVVGYIFNGTYSLPYTTYGGLYIAGTGIKSTSGNTTLSGTFVNEGSFEMGSYDFSVGGATTAALVGSKISKSGTGNITFIGFAQIYGILTLNGNPNIECRNGLQLGPVSASFVSGTGTLTFSTNNQTWSTSGGLPNEIMYWNILISGAITLTLANGVSLTVYGTFNGNNGNSILDNRINIASVSYRNAIAPMLTGKLYCNQALNKWFYDLAGDQDIQVPSDPVPGYSSLTLGGSGAKKLLGNVSVKGIYTLNGSATLDSNGFALTNP